MRELKSAPLTVIADYTPGNEFRSGLSVARFMWEEGAPRETYTIGLDNFVSLELDSHMPVRPKTVSVYDEAGEASYHVLTTAFGEDLAKALGNTKSLGFVAVNQFSLSEESRYIIAALQAQSPSTPIRLREAVTAMGIEHAATKQVLIPRTRGDQPKRRLLPRKKAA